MVLLDDRENRLMGALDQIAAGRAPFYDFSLMMDSGSLKGWFLQEESIFDAVAGILAQLKAQSPGRDAVCHGGRATIPLPRQRNIGIHGKPA